MRLQYTLALLAALAQAGAATADTTSTTTTTDDYQELAARYYDYGTSSPARTYWLIYLISFVCVLGGLFLLGFLESYWWFTRLMKGRSTMRGGTLSWIFLWLFTLCFTTTSPARSPEDQKLLREAWKELSFRQKFRLYRSWGLSRKYPVRLLGADPKNMGNPWPTTAQVVEARRYELKTGQIAAVMPELQYGDVPSKYQVPQFSQYSLQHGNPPQQHQYGPQMTSSYIAPDSVAVPVPAYSPRNSYQQHK